MMKPVLTASTMLKAQIIAIYILFFIGVSFLIEVGQGLSTLDRFGCHQLIQLSVLRELVCKRYNSPIYAHPCVTAAASGFTTGGVEANREKIMQASTITAPSSKTAQ